MNRIVCINRTYVQVEQLQTVKNIQAGQIICTEYVYWAARIGGVAGHNESKAGQNVLNTRLLHNFKIFFGRFSK